MWIFFGVAAILTAICNVIQTLHQKDAKYFRFISLSCTALTLCAFYSADAQWVVHEDWGALMDVTPTLSPALWFCTIASIGINSISLFHKRDH